MSPESYNMAGKRLHRKTRQITTCTNCRHMKLDCNRSRPSCSRCADYKVPCVYIDLGLAKTGKSAQSFESLPGTIPPSNGAASPSQRVASWENEEDSLTNIAAPALDLNSELQSALRFPSIDTLIQSQIVPYEAALASQNISLCMGQSRETDGTAPRTDRASVGFLETLYRMREQYHAVQQRVQDEEIELPDLKECEMECASARTIEQDSGRRVEDESEALNAACVSHEVAAARLYEVRERTRRLSSLKRQASQLKDQYNTQWAELDLDKL